MCHLIAVVSKKRMIARPRICVYTGIFFLFKIVINLFRKFKRFIPLRKRIKVTTAVQFFKINFCLIDYIAKLSQHISSSIWLAGLFGVISRRAVSLGGSLQPGHPANIATYTDGFSAATYSGMQ